MVILVLLAFILINAIELPILIKKKYKKEAVVFSVLMVFGFTLLMMMAIGIKLPSPTRGVIKILDILNIRF